MISADRLPVEADLLHHPGAEVLDQGVGLGDEAFHFLQVRRILEVGAVAVLVAVDGVEEGAVALDPDIGDIELAADVAGAGPFNLDHAGTQIRQPHRRRGAGQELAEVENGEAFEWFHKTINSCRLVLPISNWGVPCRDSR